MINHFSKMLVFTQLIKEIIDINILLIMINNQKTFLIEEKKVNFGTDQSDYLLESPLDHGIN